MVVHPQSIVHSLVDYVDGSTLAQLGNPDMRTALAYGLAWPERIEAGVPPLDLAAIGRLEFRPPDERAFPCLRLARQALCDGPPTTTVLNAANEVAVSAFLQGRLRFLGIPAVLESTLAQLHDGCADDLPSLLDLDARARRGAGGLTQSEA